MKLDLTITVGAATVINVGQTTILATHDSGNGNLLFAQPINLTQQATLQSLSFYVLTAAGNLILGLYQDVAGYPGTLVASTATFVPSVGWDTRPVTPTPCPPGKYWLAYNPSSNSLGFVNDGTSPSKGAGKFTTHTFGPLPSVFPIGGSGASQFSFYGTFSIATAPSQAYTTENAAANYTTESGAANYMT